MKDTDDALAAQFEAAWADPTRFTDYHEAAAFKRLVDARELDHVQTQSWCRQSTLPGKRDIPGR